MGLLKSENKDITIRLLSANELTALTKVTDTKGIIPNRQPVTAEIQINLLTVNRQPTTGEIRPLSMDEIEIDLLTVNRPPAADEIQVIRQ